MSLCPDDLALEWTTSEHKVRTCERRTVKCRGGPAASPITVARLAGPALAWPNSHRRQPPLPILAARAAILLIAVRFPAACREAVRFSMAAAQPPGGAGSGPPVRLQYRKSASGGLGGLGGAAVDWEHFDDEMSRVDARFSNPKFDSLRHVLTVLSSSSAEREVEDVSAGASWGRMPQRHRCLPPLLLLAVSSCLSASVGSLHRSIWTAPHSIASEAMCLVVACLQP